MQPSVPKPRHSGWRSAGRHLEIMQVIALGAEGFYGNVPIRIVKKHILLF